MTTYRRLFSEEAFKSYHKQDYLSENRDEFYSPIKEVNLQSENSKFLRIPQQFSSFSGKVPEFSKVQEFPLPTTITKNVTGTILSGNERISNKIIIVGFDPLYLNTVLSHFKKFGNIMDYQHFPNSNYLIINYSSQQESIYALNHYNKFLLNLTIKSVIVAEPYFGDLRPYKINLEEEKTYKFERNQEKYSTIKTPSKNVGIYKFFEHLFNW